MTLTTLFVDLNSYFASVEQQARPELRGKPVAVVPVKADSTCAIAASAEAKKFGVRTGTSVRDARRLCPGIHLVLARPGLYVQYHHRILEAASSVLPVHKVHSIDEFSCHLMGKEREPDAALELGRRMKAAIRQHAGDWLRSSVGLAPSRFLAKVASDMHKPDGLTTIQQHELPHRLYPLALTDLPGIGPRTATRLARAGVTDVESLCARSERELVAIWKSVVGSWWYHWLRGADLNHEQVHRRTVGHQHVLPPSLRTEEGARAVLVRLVHKAAARARVHACVARRLSLSVRFMDRTKWKAETQLPECNDTTTIVHALAELWSKKPRASAAPLKVSAVLSDLCPAAMATPPLFGGAQERQRLSKTIDALNAKFGKNTIYLASMKAAENAAPTRIAFGHIPDLSSPDSQDAFDPPKDA